MSKELNNKPELSANKKALVNLIGIKGEPTTYKWPDRQKDDCTEDELKAVKKEVSTLEKQITDIEKTF